MFIQNILSKLADSEADTTGFWSDLYTKRYTSDKIPSRCPLDASTNDASIGRSMVEMLGVLAIIGVLSVGAISGYSKAMFKYKLNKQTEQLNTVFNAVDRNLHSFNNLKVETGGAIDITSYFIKMGEIPTEMIKESNNYIFDIFNNKIFIRKEYSASVAVYAVYIDNALSASSNNNLEACQNIITIAKEHADSLYLLYTYSTNSNNQPVYTLYMGDKYCRGNNCIRNINLDDIYKICTQHIGNNQTGFTIRWPA